MERWSQAPARQAEEKLDKQTNRTGPSKPEQRRLSGAGQVVQALLTGQPLLDLPPGKLVELAGWMGNQGMLALLELQAKPLKECSVCLPGEAPETVPFPVPDTVPILLEAPLGLAAAESAGSAFDPGALLG